MSLKAAVLVKLDPNVYELEIILPDGTRRLRNVNTPVSDLIRDFGSEIKILTLPRSRHVGRES